MNYRVSGEAHWVICWHINLILHCDFKVKAAMFHQREMTDSLQKAAGMKYSTWP